MTFNWKEWEGRTVDGRFVLGAYLGGSDGSAVFRTQAGDPPLGAAIKLVPLDGADASAQLQQWKTVATFDHPNLIRILTTGHTNVDGRELVYVVEEYAEENLAQIVPERALTVNEVRGMLPPLLGALEYIHGKKMVHGRIRPANILAAGDQVKLSSDDLRAAGEIPPAPSPYDAPEVLMGVSQAGDVWSLGITLVEVLTQRLPVWDTARMSGPELGNAVPEPFRAIARQCLQVDPAKRCTLAEIRDRLEGKRVPSDVSPIAAVVADRESVTKWPYVLLLAAVVVIALFLFMRTRSSDGTAVEQASPAVTSSTPKAAAPEDAAGVPAPVKQETSSAPSPAPKAVESDKKVPARSESRDGVVERAMPQVSPSARRTIQGRIKVRVKVKVDGAGNVAEASFRDSGPSKYFARVAMEAAKQWKFDPAPDEHSRDWTLQFVFARSRTEASAARAR